MNEEIYYNIKTSTTAERESFNNTILLLTLVKSRYYYIVGFSRPDNLIEIAFDYESELHAAISESVTMDFATDDEWVLMQAKLHNVSAENAVAVKETAFEGSFRCDGKTVVYDFKVKKDKLIPIGIQRMNEYILKAKSEIVAYLELCFEQCLS